MARGKVVLTLGDDVSTDILYPGRFMATVLPTETPQFALADYTEFNAKLRAGVVPRGSVVVAGANFGCGSSREQAVSCLKGHDLVVVAKNVARIFLQNAINLGFVVLICPDIQASEGDEIEVAEGAVINHTTGKTFPTVPLPSARQAIVEAGGLIPYTRRLMLERRASA